MQDEDLEEKRRLKAYAIWESEGRPEGRHLDHWQAADDNGDAQSEETREAQTDDMSSTDLAVPPADRPEDAPAEDPAEGSSAVIDRQLAS